MWQKNDGVKVYRLHLFAEHLEAQWPGGVVRSMQ
jgi:hypothetical protein